MGKSKRGTYVGKWPGGRIWRREDGQDLYIIRRQVAGVRYVHSTGATSLPAAMKHLERFQANPAAYRPSGEAGEPLPFTKELVEEYLRWCAREAGNDKEWIARKRVLLAWWTEKFHGTDLRRATLAGEILPALDGAPDRAKRIEVIKSFYGWLRKHAHKVKPQEDPTFGGVLPVPPARPAQWDKSKVIPREHYLLALEHLVGPWRDALKVLAGTGWHVTELIRFANTGAVEPLPKSMRVKHGAVAVLVCPRHKSGDVHRTAVSAEVKEAAEALRARGWPADSKYPFYKAVESACLAAQIPAFNPGQFRHSTATWAIEAGADPAAVAAFLGHRSPATTKRFYAVHAVTPKVPTLA